MSTNHADVRAFQAKFGIPMPTVPQLLPADVLNFRVNFMQEELDEFVDACVKQDLPKAADALVDLAYVVHGTATMMGLPWQALWDEVQRANMGKVRAQSVGASLAGTGRGHVLDVIKPPGWTPPDIEGVLQRYQRRQDVQASLPLQVEG